jgi:cyclomaltodextrinase / maltogenic alpha-amylase / neopullulanase
VRNINQHAVLHIADSAYCFPISKNEIVLRLRTARDDFVSVWVIYESKYRIATSQKKAPMTKKMISALYDYYSVTLKLEDTRLAYVFCLYDGNNYYYFSEDGLTKTYDFTLGYYNFFQYPYINEADILTQIPWTRHAVFYQIFVDRFCIGNTQKEKSYINCSWGDIPTPKTFAGGDLRGIIEKLDYIRELGVNAVYLTPIFQSKSNHKYDISDYLKIDEHFGTAQDLKELVNRAHEQNIRIVLDAVFNHCSMDMMQFQDVCRKGKASPYYNWFLIDGDRPDPEKGNYEMFASCTNMPKLNTSNRQVQDFLINIGTYYVQQYDIDGWRLDVSDEISHAFWRRFRSNIKSVKQDCIIIGENWHDASNYLHGDQYDSIMNYAFTKACLDYFAWGNFTAEQMAAKLNDLLARNTDTVNSMMLNLLDSHDTHRFYSEVGEDTEKFNAALCLLFLFPGMPCIFYGTELRMPGGYDPDCRRCMDWGGIAKGNYNETIQKIRRLSDLRHKYDLSSADYRIYAVENILVIKRFTADFEIRLYINLTNHASHVDGREIQPHTHCIVYESRED